MKIFTYVVLVFAVIMIGFNVSMLNFKDLFGGESLIALIGIVALLCGICILLIYRTSRMIHDKTK